MKRFLLPAAALFMAACQDAAAPPAGNSPPLLNHPSANVVVIPDRYIVVLRPEVQDVVAIARDLIARHGGSYDRVYSHALKGFAGTMPEGVARAIAASPLVRYVEQDQVVTAIGVQEGATWGISRIDQRDLPAGSQYVYNATGAGVHAYIIDTGIRLTHSEFGGRATSGHDAIDGGPADDCNGHGTHVAGTVGGMTYGVAKNVSLVAVRVLDCGGSGTDSGVIEGIDWVTGNAVKPATANMSLGGGFSQALNDAVKRSSEAGVVYAVAAGNGYANACDGSPASEASALTVGATDINDNEASFSDRGSCLDIWAPGVSITSSWSTSNTATNTISGTSMATPHVVGAIALYLEGNRTATAAQVDEALTDNATTGKITWSNPFGLKPSPPPLGEDYLLYTGFITGVTPVPPSAPSGLTATAVSSSQINLAWADNSNNESNFEVERCTGTPCTFAKVATVGANATSYQDTGLSGSTSYSYRVRATNAGVPSGYSNEDNATTSATPVAPVAPSSLTATAVGQTQINLAWTNNSDNEDGFKIERCTGAVCTNFAQIATVSANVVTYNNTGLSSRTTYSYRVRAYNAGGDSDYSNTATATTADAPPVARFTWSCTAKGGKQCNFNASSSSDDGAINSYSWDFGDFTTGMGPTVTKRYTSGPSRTVTLTVRDNATPTQQTGTRACTVANGSTGNCRP